MKKIEQDRTTVSRAHRRRNVEHQQTREIQNIARITSTLQVRLSLYHVIDAPKLQSSTNMCFVYHHRSRTMSSSMGTSNVCSMVLVPAKEEEEEEEEPKMVSPLLASNSRNDVTWVSLFRTTTTKTGLAPICCRNIKHTAWVEIVILIFDF